MKLVGYQELMKYGLSYMMITMFFFIANQIIVVLDDLITVSVSIPSDIEIGSYDVHVDDLVLENGFVVDVIDAIADNYLADAVSIYPNPASDNVVVSAPIGSQVVITDIGGRRLSEFKVSGKTIDIDVSSYNSGLYLVQITHNGVAFSGKLIKN